MTDEKTISEKIMLLKGIEIFQGLSVSELAAIASVVEEVDYPAGKIIIKEGTSGETLYLMINGEVSVIKDLGGINEVEMDRMTTGNYFGEMALFEDAVRSASIRTEKPSAISSTHAPAQTKLNSGTARGTRKRRLGHSPFCSVQSTFCRRKTEPALCGNQLAGVDASAHESPFSSSVPQNVWQFLSKPDVGWQGPTRMGQRVRR